MDYLRLTQEERYQIQALVASGISVRAIGRQLNRNASTISRELRKRRSENNGKYLAQHAQKAALSIRCRARPDLHKIRGNTQKYIREKIELDWSPEQITGRMKLERKQAIPFLTIYRFIQRDRDCGGKLWTHLRVLKNFRRGRKAKRWKSWSYLPDRVSIEERPKVVEKRNRLGDYERDTVLGKRGKSVLLTIVDRTSRLLKLDCLKKSTSDGVHRSTVRLLKNEPAHTLTNDNGFEFLCHAKTTETLSLPIYFSKAYRSWERGTNENTNGLLRQYFPKKKDIGHPTRKQLEAIAERINSRPRKIFGFRTANEIHNQMKSGGVALDL